MQLSALLCGGLAVVVANIVTAQNSRHSKPLNASMFLAVLEALNQDADYRVSHTQKRYVVPPRRVDSTREFLRSLGFRIQNGTPIPRPTDLLRGDGGLTLTSTHRDNELSAEYFVAQRATGVFQSYWNSEDELDLAIFWSPQVLISYNPGRKQLHFRLGESACPARSLSEMYRPVPIGSNVTKVMERAIVRTLTTPQLRRGRVSFAIRVREKELQLIVNTASGLPVRAAAVSQGSVVEIAEYEYSAVNGIHGRLAISSSDRLTFANGKSGVFQASRTKNRIRHVRLDKFSRLRIQVRISDQVFEHAPGQNTTQSFRGVVNAHKLPSVLARRIQIVRQPKVLWRR